MDLKKLEIFASVARYGSLRQAAARRGQTLASLSIQIKKLEEELGVQLFEHHSNKLTLSDRGRVFLKGINRVFETLEEAKDSVSQPSGGFVGTLAVSLSTDLARLYAPAIASFIMAHPRLKVTVMAQPSEETLAHILDEEIDLGVGLFKKVPRSIKKHNIQTTDYSLICPLDHPLRKRKDLTLGDLASYRMVLPRRHSASRRTMDAVFARHAIELSDVVEVGRCQSVMDFVELGLGVGLVHNICALAESRPKLHIINVSQYFGTTDVALITRVNANLGPAHVTLIDHLIKSAATMFDLNVQNR